MYVTIHITKIYISYRFPTLCPVYRWLQTKKMCAHRKCRVHYVQNIVLSAYRIPEILYTNENRIILIHMQAIRTYIYLLYAE